MHGIKLNEPVTGTRPILASSLAIIGLVATADAAAGPALDALNAAFPVDEPVLVTDVRAAVAKAGETGTLKAALAGIADQANPLAVVVRISEPVAPEDLDAAVVAGIDQLLGAEVQLGVRPRILGAPGLDTQVVTTALAEVAGKLRAFSYALAVAEDIADVATYRQNFGKRELMLLWPNTSADFAGDAVARAMGLRAAIDESFGWHKTLSNVAMNGVTGLAVPIFFDLHSDANDAGVINAANVTTIIRSNGFRFWGNRTCSDEPLFAFESTVRTAQAIQDEIAAGLMWAIDKPITRSLFRDIEETINARLRQLVAEGLRKRRDENWVEQSLSAIVGKIAKRQGLTPKVHPLLANVQIPAIRQKAKSDIAFVSELGRRYDAVATVKAGHLILAPIGIGSTAGGAALPGLTIQKAMCSRYGWTRKTRDEHDGVEAEWHDQAGAKRQMVKVGGSANPRRLKRTYANESDARAAAEGANRRDARTAAEFTLTLAYGDASLMPERPVTLSGFKSEIDTQIWQIAEVSHRIDGRGGFTTELTLDLGA